PNFGHWSHRSQILRGRMPVSRSLPYQWYDTPNIHLCTVADFGTSSSASAAAWSRTASCSPAGARGVAAAEPAASFPPSTASGAPDWSGDLREASGALGRPHGDGASPAKDCSAFAAASVRFQRPRRPRAPPGGGPECAADSRFGPAPAGPPLFADFVLGGCAGPRRAPDADQGRRIDLHARTTSFESCRCTRCRSAPAHPFRQGDRDAQNMTARFRANRSLIADGSDSSRNSSTLPVQHAVAVHKHSDTPDLRAQIRTAVREPRHRREPESTSARPTGPWGDPGCAREAARQQRLISAPGTALLQ
ncbi:MAG: hypothetical protein IPI27_14255, partial [Betaproteobacteria bacterium]|nr:hypothetical protein [Betaproteobacteria bacterium]